MAVAPEPGRRFTSFSRAPRSVAGLAWSINRIIGLLIVASISATVLESEPRLREEYEGLFKAIEIVSLAAFSIEYCLRIWIAPEHIPYRHLRAAAGVERLYSECPQGIVDFLAVAPLWGALAGFSDLRILVILRVLRVLKFAPIFFRHAIAARGSVERAACAWWLPDDPAVRNIGVGDRHASC